MLRAGRSQPGKLLVFRLFGRHVRQELPRLSPAFLIVALLACVLVPLPTLLVDLMLSLSLAAGVLLLVAALRVRRSADFLSFPTLLLLTTLFRIALNVSTTRLILSQADAGRVIDSFASVVVRSDLIVGGVIFLIITMVQYLVIARGAERVAEVTARFALDALPGHQSSIDADLRSGAISAQQAARQRSELMERSTFYGAMDGAVRFVKNDAIAGVIITTINLAGGLAVGVGRLGLSWHQSLDTFGRLTIGDGLLAQIPALLISLAAGVLVARVDRQQETRRQPWLEPAMLIVPASLLGLMAIIPGMPSFAFGAIAVGLLVGALALSAARGVPTGATQTRARLFFCVSPADFPEPRRIQKGLWTLQTRCSQSLGLELPTFALDHHPRHAAGKVDIRFGDHRLARFNLPPGRESESRLWLEGFRNIMAHCTDIVDLQDLDEWIEGVRRDRPAVAQEALRVLDRSALLSLVHGMLAERLAVPPMTSLLSVVASESAFRDPSERPRWLETLRRRTARHWLLDLVSAQNELGSIVWLRPTPDFEEAVIQATSRGTDTLILSAGDVRQAQWRTAFQTTESGHDSQPRPVVVVTSVVARPAFGALLRGCLPHIPVLSSAELAAADVDQPASQWVDAESSSVDEG